MAKADTSFALQVRLMRAKTMYRGDYRKDTTNNNTLPCCTSGSRGAGLYTTQKYQYPTRLFDVALGQRECCRTAGVSQTVCNCVGCLPQA